ncbi:MAG: hypothetical protein GY849_16050 [Deltaproteobacteria bacterium]|nr:hypothetical protein [Deltaproteobacteria bacterium]
MAFRRKDIVGRCAAFVNHDHNQHWKDKVGFFGQFEAIRDYNVADVLFRAAGAWLKSQGMEVMRGPQNLPVNEATPGFLTDGFHTRPIIYYHYNKPYYADLVKHVGFRPVKQVFSWEYTDMRPWDDRFVTLVKKIVKRFDIRIETWGERPLKERIGEMLEIYNEAWFDNWGFVPFRREAFYRIIEEMQLIIDKGLFIFLYVNEEPAAFFGAVPNIAERIVPIKGLRRCEWLRAAKMVLTKGRTKGMRLGYLGIKKKFRRRGLDGVMLWKQKAYSLEKGYEYCDVGWVLEDNTTLIKMIEMAGSTLSKTYTIFEKPIE